MSDLFEEWTTPVARFRKWRDTGTMECMVNGVWQSIPGPAQKEINRLMEVIIGVCSKMEGLSE